MKKKLLAMVVAGVMSMSVLAGCGGEAEAPAADNTEAAASGEITFADLQSNYAELSGLYDQVEELYMNDGIAQDDNIESLLAQAKDVIDQMGEITEDQLPSQADMKSINDSMISLADSLGKIVDGMEVVDNSEAEVETEVEVEDEAEAEAVEVVYDGGYYVTDGSADYVLAFFETSDGDAFAYVSDGSDEAYAEYEVGEEELEDGTVIVTITVGNLTLGYFEDEEGNVYFVNDADGSVYSAVELDEESAAALIGE